MSRKNLEQSKIILDEIKKHFNFRTWEEVADKLHIKSGTLGSWRSKGGLDEDAIIEAIPNVNLAFLKKLEGPFIVGDRNNTSGQTIINGHYNEVKHEHIPIDEIEELVKKVDELAYVRAIARTAQSLDEEHQLKGLMYLMKLKGVTAEG